MAAIGVRDIDFGPWWRHEHPAIEPLGGELLQHGPARRELQRSGSVDEAAVEEHGSTQVFRTCPILERELDRPLGKRCEVHPRQRSEEHTSELQSLMSISYAVFRLTKQ